MIKASKLPTWQAEAILQTCGCARCAPRGIRDQGRHKKLSGEAQRTCAALKDETIQWRDLEGSPDDKAHCRRKRPELAGGRPQELADAIEPRIEIAGRGFIEAIRSRSFVPRKVDPRGLQASRRDQAVAELNTRGRRRPRFGHPCPVVDKVMVFATKALLHPGM